MSKETVKHELTGLFSGPNWYVRVYAIHEAPKDWELPEFISPEWYELEEMIQEEASEDCLDLHYADCDNILVGWKTGLSGP